MNLSIIIVTHNSEDVISRCISSLGSHFKGNTLVVDNGSTDGTVSLMRKEGVKVLQLGRNMGFGQAANLGAKAVSEPFLCFLNPDCEPTPALFFKGLKALEDHPYRCVVPSLIDGNGTVVDGVQPGYTRTKLCADMLQTNCGYTLLWRWLRGRSCYNAKSWSWPHGACFFIARDFFLQLNGFSPHFFMYMEDVDLGFRIAQSGGEIVALEYQLKHHTASGSEICRSRRLFLLNSGRLMYARLYYGHLFAAFLRLVLLLAKSFQTVGVALKYLHLELG